MFIIYDKLEKIGHRIQKARKQKNLTQIQFAELLNISTSHLSDIETGRTNFGIDILMNITELLQVSADYILRTDIPEVAAIHSREIDAILKDCSASETEMLIKMLSDVKKTEMLIKMLSDVKKTIKKI